MTVALHVVLMIFAGSAPEDVVRITARIDAEKLEVGQEYHLVFDARFADGWSGGKAGIAAPFLQIALPDSVELTGRVLTTYKELSKNEFLCKPFERLLPKLPVEVGFKLVKEPKPEDRIALNFVSYASPTSGDDAWFVRRRLSLPVSANATASLVAPTDSTWGVNDFIQIGDTAPGFTLPRADGTKVSLESFRGKNVIVTTYRAFW